MEDKENMVYADHEDEADSRGAPGLGGAIGPMGTRRILTRGLPAYLRRWGHELSNGWAGDGGGADHGVGGLARQGAGDSATRDRGAGDGRGADGLSRGQPVPEPGAESRPAPAAGRPGCTVAVHA